MFVPQIVFSPLKNGVHSQGGAVDVLVRIQAPDLPSDGPPFMVKKRLNFVVDCSGSMRGEPLAQALRCVEYIASQLNPEDQIGLVTYSSDVRVMLPVQPVCLDKLRDATARVHAYGMTHLHGGWSLGVQGLEPTESSSVSRVILLSDGRANIGLTDRDALSAHAKRASLVGVSTTTIGLGPKFDERLMTGMAEGGGGQSYYGQTATDMFDGFSEELSLLQATYLPKFTLRFLTPPGVMLEMLSPVKPKPNSSHEYMLGHLPWGGERWLAVRLHISASAPGTPRDILSASLEAVAPNLTAIDAHSGLLQVPVLGADAWGALAVDPQVDARFQELKFSRAMDKFHVLAENGSDQEVKKLLSELQTNFASHEWLMSKLDNLQELSRTDKNTMMKEAHFAARRTSSRLSRKNEPAFQRDETFSEDIPAFLRRKVEEGKGVENPGQGLGDGLDGS